MTQKIEKFHSEQGLRQDDKASNLIWRHLFHFSVIILQKSRLTKERNLELNIIAI
jgi:hypothetical protein